MDDDDDEAVIIVVVVVAASDLSARYVSVAAGQFSDRPR